jgi:hypothetical protein
MQKTARLFGRATTLFGVGFCPALTGRATVWRGPPDRGYSVRHAALSSHVIARDVDADGVPAVRRTAPIGEAGP